MDDWTVTQWGQLAQRQLKGTVVTIGTVAVFDGMAQWLRLVAWYSGCI